MLLPDLLTTPLIIAICVMFSLKDPRMMADDEWKYHELQQWTAFVLFLFQRQLLLFVTGMEGTRQRVKDGRLLKFD